MTDELQILAAEYVLGTLDPAEQRAAERMIAQDPDFGRLVETWKQRLASLLLAVPPETPAPEVWHNIQAALRQRAAAVSSAAPPPARSARGPSTPLLERLGFWRWCTLGAGAVAAALAIYIGVRPLAPPPAPATRYVATLNQDGSDPAWLVTVDLARQELTIRPVAEAAGRGRQPGQALELWLVAGEGGPPPRSLGLLDRETGVSLAFPAVASPSEAGVLAISLEPPGGSPTGSPTGPVVYSGKILPVSAPD